MLTFARKHYLALSGNRPQLESCEASSESLGLATHPVERLAKLLLSWTSDRNEDASSNDCSFKLPLTHQEIVDYTGSTRETITKLFSELRRNLLRSKGRELTIMNLRESLKHGGVVLAT